MTTEPNHMFLHQLKTGGSLNWRACNGSEARNYRNYIDNDFTFSHLEWPKYAWPGGYPIYYVVKDGGVLCADCANQELMRTIDPEDDQFYILAGDINYENNDLYCDHCNKKIESAYGEDDDK